MTTPTDTPAPEQPAIDWGDALQQFDEQYGGIPVTDWTIADFDTWQNIHTTA
jgi:hypothetical protein